MVHRATVDGSGMLPLPDEHVPRGLATRYVLKSHQAFTDACLVSIGASLPPDPAVLIESRVDGLGQRGSRA